jgi:hypothetical protein
MDSLSYYKDSYGKDKYKILANINTYAQYAKKKDLLNSINVATFAIE